MVLCTLVCLSVYLPLALLAEVQLDFLNQKGAIKRTLFLHNHQSHFTFPFVMKQQKSLHCQDFMVYLRVSFLEIPSGTYQVQIPILTISIWLTIMLAMDIHISLFSLFREETLA